MENQIGLPSIGALVTIFKWGWSNILFWYSHKQHKEYCLCANVTLTIKQTRKQLIKKMKIKTQLTLLLFFCGVILTYAQTVVSGTVIGGDGQPIPGATVLVQGTNNGTKNL